MRDVIADYFQLPDPLPPSPIEIPGASRADLPKLFRTLELHRGAEIGVWTGDYSREFLETDPALQLLCVDPWQIYRDYRDNNQQHRIDEKYRLACAALAPYGDRVTVIRKFSQDAAQDVPERSLDWVYIDGNHALEFVTMDLALWGRRVRTGGIVSGHDYYHFPRPAWCHVVEAVHAYTTAMRIPQWYVLGTRHEARRSLLQHRYRSFCWVNPEWPPSRQR